MWKFQKNFYKHQYIFLLGIALILIGFSFFWMQFQSKKNQDKNFFVVTQQKMNNKITNNDNTYSFSIPKEFDITQDKNTITFSYSSGTTMMNPGELIRYILVSENSRSLEQYFQEEINNPEDPGLFLEKEQSLYINEKEIRVARIDYRKGYWPNEGGMEYLYDIPFKEKSIILAVFVNSDEQLPRLQIEQIIQQILN